MSWIYKPLHRRPFLTAMLFYLVIVLTIHGNILSALRDSIYGNALAGGVVVWEIDWAHRFFIGTPVIYLSPLLLLHTEDAFFSSAVIEDYAELLRAIFGEPLVDEGGMRLYAV